MPWSLISRYVFLIRGSCIIDSHSSTKGCQLRFYGVDKPTAPQNEKEKEENEREKEENEKDKVAKNSEDNEGDAYIEYQQTPGKAVVHFGANRHEVFPIHEGGIRYNIIIWCRNK